VHSLSHQARLTEGCLVRNAWVCPEYLSTRAGELQSATVTHLQITVISVVIAAAVALPLALLARRVAPVRPVILGAATGIYTVPSLALFSLLLPLTGLSTTTVVIGLVLYSLTVLIRSVLSALDAVPAEIVDAGRGMGLSARSLLWRVELPLGLPLLISGLRVATVSTVALATVGTVVGHGGLGDLIYLGLRANFRAQVLTASVLCVLVAVTLDLTLLAVQRLLTPWLRTVRATGAA
jgi:osmoprotectant transport system permease protein